MMWFCSKAEKLKSCFNAITCFADLSPLAFYQMYFSVVGINDGYEYICYDSTRPGTVQTPPPAGGDTPSPHPTLFVADSVSVAPLFLQIILNTSLSGSTVCRG